MSTTIDTLTYDVGPARLESAKPALWALRDRAARPCCETALRDRAARPRYETALRDRAARPCQITLRVILGTTSKVNRNFAFVSESLLLP